MNYNKTIGKYGETIAADYLINNGYEILDRNFQTRYGEVDIIGQKDDMIIFFEILSVHSPYTISWNISSKILWYVVRYALTARSY